MTPKVAAALESSIQHWERNILAEHPDEVALGSEHCALCRMFIHDHCAGCPISASTGERGCLGTPYGAAEDATDDWADAPDSAELRDAFREAARVELEFLKSLRAPSEGEAEQA